VLSSTFPGMVASPPGVTNGPISGAGLNYLPINEQLGAKLLLYLSDGEVNGGYIRSWTRQPGNGDGIFIFAFSFKSATDRGSWLQGLDAGLQSQPGDTTFAAPGVPGAEGYTAHLTTSAGAPLSENVVTFDKGDTIFMVIVGSSTGDLTSADAVSLATRQAANAPGASSTSSKIPTYEIGGAVGAALLVVLIVVATRRRRNRPTAPTVQRSSFQPNSFQPTSAQTNTVRASSSSYPPLPTEPLECGWTAVGDSDSVEWYWDGRAWTDRRELTPAESE
jgi:hypothetical protein